MDFLAEAQTSYYTITCKAIRSVLYECACEALQCIIESRTSESPSSALHQTQFQDSTIAGENPRRLEITQLDVDICYSFARKIGRRWADKLFMTDDESNRLVVKIIKLVLENGEFFNKDFCDQVMQIFEEEQCHDDISESDHMSSDFSAGNSGPMAGSTFIDRSVQQQAEHHRLNKQYAKRRDQQTAILHGNVSHEYDQTKYEIEKNLNRVQKSIPYATLIHLGQLDPCHLNSPKELLQKGTAAEWKALPSLSSTNLSSLVHIPNPINMPPDDIQMIHEDQLYGRPALNMFPKVNVKEEISIIDRLASKSRGKNERKSTMWPHDWNIVQMQVEKNKARLHPVRKNKDRKSGHLLMQGGEDWEDEDEMIQVIPKSLLGTELTQADNNDYSMHNDFDDAVDTDTCLGEVLGVPCDDGPVFVQSDERGAFYRVPVQSAVSKSWPSSRIMKKRRASKNNARPEEESNNSHATRNEDQNQSTHRKSRKPCALGNIQWTSQEIQQKLGSDTMEFLEDAMLHGNEESNLIPNTCQGYLKTLGNIHLFEQIRVGQWRGYTDDISVDREEQPNEDQPGKYVLKMRKMAHRKSKRQRIYPNYEEGTKGYQDSKLKSKILRVVKGGKLKKQKISSPTEGEEEDQCMELDLGECNFSVMISSVNENDPPIKISMAFRSIEVSLTDA